jgi:ATP-dependent Lhr-like helicase
MKMAFEIFGKRLQAAIKKRGFGSPTDIQKKGIPAIHAGGDTLIIAPTGLGKTETCLLPLFDRLVESEAESEKHKDKSRQYKPISILYITPLKSLNRDLLKRILWWSGELGFEVSVRHGDTTQYERGMQAENPPHVLISTPETLQAILTGSRMRKHLGNIRHIVVDEVHELVNGKRGVQLSIGLERLKEAIRESQLDKDGKPPKSWRVPQIIGISATVGSPERVAEYLTGGRGCEIVNAMNLRKMNLLVESPKPGGKDRDLSSKMFMGPTTTARLRRIESLIKERQSVLAFTNTRESAEVLSSRLRVLDPELKIETHHSSLSKNVRIEAEEQFKNGVLKSLVCTSSLELGIDIGLIDFILQYMSPRQVAKLTQRVGRSGHTVSGISDGVIIAAEPEDCFESAVIAKHALGGRIESTTIYGKSLDVLGHQIVGLAMDEYRIPYDKAFKIIKQAWPFRKLTDGEFLQTCMLMQRLGYVWLNDETNPPEPGKPSIVDKRTAKSDIVIKRRRKAWEYYYQNLSTIPDNKTYQILDVVSNQPVGTLDAEFMALHGSPGTSFIVKGRAWRILEVLHNKIMVEPRGGIEAAIPAWEGELIPIPRDVAQDVGSIRKEIAKLIGSGSKPAAIIKHLTGKYPVDREAASKMYRLIKAQKDWGFVPDHSNLLIEYGSVPGEGLSPGEVNVVIHSCHGSLINDTIGRVLSSLLITKLGSVGLQTDAYRIILKMQRGGVEDVVKMLNEFDPKMMESIIKLTLPNTELYRWRFLHVSKRLGIIARDADFGPGYLSKIIDVYKDKPPAAEALHEVMEEKLDIEGAIEVMNMYKEGKLKSQVFPGLSPLGEAGLAHKYEIVAPKKPDLEVFKVFKDRLMNTRVRLLCTNCGTGITHTVKDLPKGLHCVNCQSKLLAVTGAKNMDAELLLNRYLKKKGAIKFTNEEQAYLDRLADSASLVAASGKRAVIAQAGRGIGPRTAGRILRRQTDDEELLKDILREEQVYARNKRFWRE